MTEKKTLAQKMKALEQIVEKLNKDPEIEEAVKLYEEGVKTAASIREYLETHGPQNAVTIADATGVSVKTIQKFLYQGRIEIPDGSDSYIKCQMCGADIRYGIHHVCLVRP